MADRTDYKTASSIMLGAISASLVLFPSILSVVQKPFSHVGIIAVYFASCLIALGSLSFTYYIAAYTSGALPVRASGIGSIAAVIGILGFAAFLLVNMLDDYTSKPTITSLTSSAYSGVPGDFLTFSAQGFDEDGGKLRWQWTIAPPRLAPDAKPWVITGHLQNVTWRIPQGLPPGLYRISASVSDGRRASAGETIAVEVRKSR